MAFSSTHLNNIMIKQNRVSNLQVVFVDIEKYSKRRTLTQTEVIDRFTECLNNARKKTAREFIDYSEKNNINFQTDIIFIPTGDGAAAVFSFDGLHDIHLCFAQSLLQEIFEINEKTPCQKYDTQGWCNCHTNFAVRIGISEGKGIIYDDISGKPNVAGSVINLAARVMNLGDRNQIIFSKEAYKQIIDMIDDPNLVDKFSEIPEVRIKHGKVDIYQYIDHNKPYINSEPPEELLLIQRSRKAMSKLYKASGLGDMFEVPEENIKGREKELTAMMEQVGEMMEMFMDKKKILGIENG